MNFHQSIEGQRVADRFSHLQRYAVVTTTGRSGSAFVADLINKNALNASSEHEPDLVPPDVSTKWYYDFRDDELAKLVEKKIARLRRGERICSLPSGDRLYKYVGRSKLKRIIPRVPIREVYVEVDNGFLKSYGDKLLDFIPDLQFVHLTRNPLLQAKSATNRKSQPNPNRPYFLWPTWERNVFKLSESVTSELTQFQLALWYWFEMELRFVDFRERRGVEPLTEACIDELNDRETAEDLFARLGIAHRPLDLQANRNLGPRKTVITDQEHAETVSFLKLVPDEMLSRLPNTYGIEKT